MMIVDIKERYVFEIAGWLEAKRNDRPDRAIIGDPTDRSEAVSLTSVQTRKPERIGRAVRYLEK